MEPKQLELDNKEDVTEEKPEKKTGKKDLQKHFVKSSNIDWVAYDDSKENLYIGFLNGSVYKYFNVPKKLFDEMLTAGSKGRYFWAKIRRQPIEYERIQ